MKSRIITSLLFTAAQIGLAKDIVQRDLSTGKIVGGEHFTIVQQPRKAIWPEIKSTLTQEGYELQVWHLSCVLVSQRKCYRQSQCCMSAMKSEN